MAPRCKKAPAKTETTKRKKQCELTGCAESWQFDAPCCNKRLCEACLLNVMQVCRCLQAYAFLYVCPFCRAKEPLALPRVRGLMGVHCPTHAKVVETCDKKQAVIAHLPCSTGCYLCHESKLEVRLL